jgi:hypothetical protein
MKSEVKALQSKIFNIHGLKEERASLPYSRNPKEKFSIMQMIKEVIGKDLSRISMPVYLNEPLSIVQKGTENNEYSSLLK